MSVMVPLYVHTTNIVASATDMVKSRAAAVKAHYTDRGASALEYVGLVVIAAFVIGILYTVFQNAGLKDVITNKINAILNTGPSSAPSQAPSKAPTKP